jgi:glycerol-3-phosphate O-acyltransferase/dihydroxyacetone phosphate acyltransferase
LFLLCFVPRRISFLAKAPLFRMPFIGWFVRGFGSIPVYRREDNFSPAQNRETFARARETLARGGAIAIFPEGTTHSDPGLRKLKTGAARIALGVSAAGESSNDVCVVPTGIYYTSKETFRSAALVSFGPPIAVRGTGLDAEGEPELEAVERLTSAIREGIAQLTLEADSHVALDLIARAERIVSGGRPPSERIADELQLRRRFVSGYIRLHGEDPGQIESLASEIERFEAELEGEKLDLEELRVPRPGSTARFAFRAMAFLVLAVPLVTVGLVLNAIPYQLISLLSVRLARGEDELMATMKFIGAILLYPLAWIGWAVAVRPQSGTWGALVVGLAGPFSGLGAVWAIEHLDHIAGRTRAALRFAFRRNDYLRLVAERERIRQAIIGIAEQLEGQPSAKVRPSSG